MNDDATTDERSYGAAEAGRREEPAAMTETFIAEGREHLAGSSEHWGEEVVDTEILGQPCRIFTQRPRCISQLHIDARRFADRAYLVQGERRLTFREHECAVAAVARLLVERGLRPGDRTMILGANTIEWVVTFWAAIQAETIVVLGNAWWSISEVHHALEIVGAALVVADERRADSVPVGPQVVLFREIADVLNQAVSSRSPVEDEIGGGAQEDDPAVVVFTSGTTGRPKGAVLTHRGILATLQSLMLVTRRLPSTEAEDPPPSKALLSLPLFHIGGLQQILNPLVAGGTLVFSDGRFEPARILDLLADEEINVWSAVPTMVSRVLDHLEASGRSGFGNLRTLGMGASPVPEQLRQRVVRAFPNVARGVAVTYGLTEAGGVVTTGRGADILSRPGSVGKPLPVVSVRIADPDGSGAGEVLVRSPSLMLGYWGTDDSGIDDDRWLHTGDIGRLDADGYLYITDRRNDIVIRGGENIASAYVEGRLAAHPAVQEIAVVGLPHPELGEEVGAVVVPRPGAHVTSEDLAVFAAQSLAYFEVPSRWWIRADILPKNSTGKVMKRVVRAEWLEQPGSAVEPCAAGVEGPSNRQSH